MEVVVDVAKSRVGLLMVYVVKGVMNDGNVMVCVLIYLC